VVCSSTPSPLPPPGGAGVPLRDRRKSFGASRTARPTTPRERVPSKYCPHRRVDLARGPPGTLLNINLDIVQVWDGTAQRRVCQAADNIRIKNTRYCEIYDNIKKLRPSGDGVPAVIRHTRSSVVAAPYCVVVLQPVAFNRDDENRIRCSGGARVERPEIERNIRKPRILLFVKTIRRDNNILITRRRVHSSCAARVARVFWMRRIPIGGGGWGGGKFIFHSPERDTRG